MHFQFTKNKLKLAASIAEIADLHASKKDQKTTDRAAELMDKAPGAAAKLKANGGEVMCLTVVEIFAVALRYFGKALKKVSSLLSWTSCAPSSARIPASTRTSLAPLLLPPLFLPPLLLPLP